MGCFNYRCAVSHAPIRPDDNVRLFFLIANPGRYRTKNPTFNGFQLDVHDAFKVIGGISLKATYIDYGNFSFKNENDVFSKHLLSTIRDNYIVQTEQDTNKSIFMKKYICIQKENLDFDNIMNMIHHGCLYMTDEYGDGELIVNVMAIHEDIYNLMIKEVGSPSDGDQKEDYAYKNINPFKELTKISKSDPRPIFKHYKNDQSFNFALMYYGFMYQPMITANQNYQFNDTYDLLFKISKTLMQKQANEHSRYEPKIKTKINVKTWQEINLSDLMNQLSDMWMANDEELKTFCKFLKAKTKNLNIGEKIEIKAKDLKKEKHQFLYELINNDDIDLVIVIDTRD